MTRLGIHRRGGVEGSAPTPAPRPRDRAGGREMNFVFTDDAVFAAQRARERRRDADDDDGVAARAAHSAPSSTREAFESEMGGGGWCVMRLSRVPVVGRAVRRWSEDERSLMMFPPESRFRKSCDALANNRAFQGLVVACIVAASVVVAVVKPRRDGEGEAMWILASSYAVTAVFGLEAAAKIVALGFAFGPGAYLSTNWHRFDFTLVVLSVIFAPMGGTQVITVRLLRAFHSFRVFARYRNGRLVMKTVARALPLLGDVVLFLLWFLIVFAVSGVTLFGGKMTGRLYSTPPAQAGNASYAFPTGTASEICAALTVEWRGNATVGADGTYPNEYNSTCNYKNLNREMGTNEWCCDSGIEPYDGFLNFGDSARSSLVALNGMTIDGWNELLNPAAYAVGYAKAFTWFIFVVLIGGFFMMELFTSVICTTLTQINLREDEAALQDINGEEKESEAVNSSEREFNRNDSAANHKSLSAGQKRFQSFREACYRYAEDPVLDFAVTMTIIFNTVLMMAQHHNAPKGFVKASNILEYIFLALFALEMAIKHFGYGIAGYWRSKENAVDGLVVITGLVSVAVAGQGVSTSFIRLLRIARAFRTFRVIRNNVEFRKIISSAYIGFQDMWPFLVVWMLFQTIFAIYGFQLFSGLGNLDNERLTFRNVLRSALTLFVVATGEDSFIVAWNTMVASGSNVAVLYTIAWIFLSTVILSLVLGILIDACSLVEVEEDTPDVEFRKQEKLRASIERAEKMTLNPFRALKRKIQNITFATSAFKDSVRKKFVHKRELLKNKNVDKGELEEAYPNVQSLRDKEGVNHEETFSSRKSLRGESLSITSSLLSVITPVDHGGKLVKAKRARLQKQIIEDVAACRVFLDSIGFKMVRPSKTIKVSELALEEARRRLTPKFMEYQDYQDKAFGITDSIKNSIKRQMKNKYKSSQSVGSEVERKRDDFEPAGPWARALMAETFASTRQEESIAIPGVIVTKEGEFIPVYDETISVERYKSKIHSIVSHNYFENVILCMIIASSILLATETKTWPVPGSSTANAYQAVDIAFTTIFTAEMALKLFAYGLYAKPTAYLRSYFNALDAVVVITSLTSLLFSGSGGESVRAMRLLRIMRPLRSIRRFPGLRLVVNTVLSAIPAVSYVCFIGLVSMSIFALLGMELFMGKFWSCRVVEDASTYTTQALCEAAGGEWRNSKFHFDNFGAALLSTFILHAGDDWQEIMWVAMDTTGIDTGLQVDNNQAAALYFVVTVAIGNFFWLNLLVTALVDNFNKMASQDKLTFATPAQRRWQQAILRASTEDTEAWRKIVPPPGADLWSRARLMAHRMSKPKKFAHFMLLVIITNVIEMLLQTENMDTAKENTHFWFSIVFTLIYFIEMCLLLMAQGRRYYFRNYWNWLDAIVVAVSIAQAIGQSLNAAGPLAYLQLVRLLRLLKLVKAHSGLRSLFNTFIMSLPGVGNVAALSSLVIFSYAIMGVALFGDMRGPYEGGVLSKYSNFQSFPTACSSLIAVYTGGWVGTFSEVYQTEACLRTEAPFLPESSIDCEINGTAIPYFLSFVAISIFLLGNLFIAIILERFSVSADEEGLYDTAEVVEIIKHTIQLRRLALRIKNAVRARNSERDSSVVEPGESDGAPKRFLSIMGRLSRRARKSHAPREEVARANSATEAAPAVVEDEPIDDDDSSLQAVTETDARVVHVVDEEDALESRDEPRRAAAPVPRDEPPATRRLPAVPIGESRFKSHDAYVSRTTLGAIDASELDDPSDEDEYPFRRESAGRRPALNTPVDARSERALSERDAPLDQDAYDGERSVNAYGPSDDDDDFLQEFREDERKTSRAASSLLSDASDDGATGGNTSDARSRGDIIDRL